MRIQELGLCFLGKAPVGFVAGQVGETLPLEDERASCSEPVGFESIGATRSKVENVGGDAGGGVEGIGEGVS